MFLLVSKVFALSLLDQIVLKIVRRCTNPPKLPFRLANPNVKGLKSLQGIDYLYLSINQVIEYIFALNVIMFTFATANDEVVDGNITSSSISSSTLVPWSFHGATLLNTFVALYLLFVIDDLLYAPTHYFMHWKVVYPYIHKHHHRQILPRRGYTDAGNEHPLEQVAGLSIVWITMHVVRMCVGLHVVTILLHFVLYAALALLNHTDMDVNFSFVGFDYSVGAHEMHHRNPECNMAQYWMGLDKYVLGTYRPYTNGKKTKIQENNAGVLLRQGEKKE